MNTQEWNRLVSGWMEGTLDAPDQERLQAICREHPEKEQELARSMLADRLLPLAFSPGMEEAAVQRILARIGEEGDVSHGEVPWVAEPSEMRPAHAAAKTVRFSRRGIALAAAAAVVLSLAGWFTMEAWRPMGYLSRSESLVWENGGPPAGDGKLSRGQHLRASSGLAELELRNGARLVLEAPFDVELTGYKEVTLNSGRLAARCPPSARGFTILTPRGKVTDLGTELGVHVEDDGVVEAHVLTGSAAVAGIHGERKMSLFDGEAVRMESAVTRRVNADPTAFVTMMPLPEDVPTGYVHWNMDEGAGTTAADSGHGLTGGADASLTLAADEAGLPGAAPPQWIKGVRGTGLAFDGSGSYAESTYRGIEGALPRTVALWVRIPDPDIHAGAGILSWGTVMEDSAWQISLNWSPVDGPIGRLRLGTYAGRIVGTTDLRDGGWHHIAVVMYPPSHKEASVNVLLYVDGKLEPISLRSNFRVNTNIRQAEHGVSLGRHVSLIDKTQKFFHGEMDDVFILGRPLMQEQIIRLMKGNAEYAPPQ